MKYLTLITILFLTSCTEDVWEKADCIPNEYVPTECDHSQLLGVWESNDLTLKFDEIYVEYDGTLKQWMPGSDCNSISVVVEVDDWDTSTFEIRNDSLFVNTGILSNIYWRRI